MITQRQEVSVFGEDLAQVYLQEKGYRVLERNCFLRWGEIDLVCQNGQKLVFVEVKTRIGHSKGKPHEAITAGKLKRLHHSIEQYVLKHKLYNYTMSFDIIAINLSLKWELQEIRHYRNLNFNL